MEELKRKPLSLYYRMRRCGYRPIGLYIFIGIILLVSVLVLLVTAGGLIHKLIGFKSIAIIAGVCTVIYLGSAGVKVVVASVEIMRRPEV